MFRIVDLKNKIYKEVAVLLRQHIHNYESIVSILAEIIYDTKTMKIIFRWKTNMLSQPEFHELKKSRTFIDDGARTRIL